MEKIFILTEKELTGLLKEQRLNCSEAYEMPQDISKPMRYCIENAPLPPLPQPIDVISDEQVRKEFDEWFKIQNREGQLCGEQGIIFAGWRNSAKWLRNLIFNTNL